MRSLLLIFIFLSNTSIFANPYFEGGCGCDNILSTESCVVWHYDKDKHELVISGKGNMNDFSVGNLPPWIKREFYIHHVIIEEGVCSVGNYSFYKVPLESVSIAQSVYSIGYFAFEKCYMLSSVSLPKNIKFIGGGAFKFCTNLRRIKIPKSCKEIKYDTFFACFKLKKIKYDKSCVMWCGMHLR